MLSGHTYTGFEGEYSTVQASDLLLLRTVVLIEIGKANSMSWIDPIQSIRRRRWYYVALAGWRDGEFSALVKALISSSEIESMREISTNLRSIKVMPVRFSVSSTSANSASYAPMKCLFTSISIIKTIRNRRISRQYDFEIQGLWRPLT